MIIDNGYFTGELYLAEAKPSMTSEVKDVESKLNDFIDDYVPDCILKCFGNKLGYEFIAELDSTEENGLKASVDAKWDDLLNGKTYTDSNGDSQVWKGMRWKSNTEGKYNRSFLASYVYYHFESNDDSHRTGAGNFRIEAANAISVGKSMKVVKAWRKFVKLVQGELSTSPYSVKSGQYGGFITDYYTGDEEINLYQFIVDSNDLVADTYADFNPKNWKNMNQLGI